MGIEGAKSYRADIGMRMGEGDENGGRDGGRGRHMRATMGNTGGEEQTLA